MTEPRLNEIASDLSNHEASILRSLLAAHGIEARITNTATADILAYIGPAVGGARVLVHEEDASRALALLQEHHDKPPTASPATDWRCAQCGETVEGDFDLCWSCGSLRPDQPAIDTASSDPEAEGDANPGMATEEDGDSESSTPSARPADAEATVDRAFKAALMGLFFFPLGIYAFLLLASLSGETLSPKGTFRFYATLLLVLLTSVGILAFFGLFGRP